MRQKYYACDIDRILRENYPVVLGRILNNRDFSYYMQCRTSVWTLGDGILIGFAIFVCFGSIIAFVIAVGKPSNKGMASPTAIKSLG